MSPRKKNEIEPECTALKEHAEQTHSFETALERLERIVQNLESEDLTLDDALSDFERGMHLLRICNTHLNNARGRITELMKGDDGAFVEKILGTSLESFLNEKNIND